MPPNTLPLFDDTGLTRYQNWHNTVDQPLVKLYDVWNADPNRSSLAGYNGTAEGLRAKIGEALAAEVQLRALGGTWSFTPIAATGGILLNTRPLNYRFPLAADQLNPAYQGGGNLFMIQCGMSIAALNAYLGTKGMALRTCGASNGQTLAGAMSTGTHGAALDVGAVQDYVVGIHLLTSPTTSVWLERATYPVVKESVAASVGATLESDDELFNAAVVGFGSFGIVAGVVIEADPMYFLNSFQKRMPLDATLWQSIADLDFQNANLPGPGRRPYHYQVLINPFEAALEGIVQVKYREGAVPPGTTRPKPGKITQGDDALQAVGLLTDLFPDLSGGIANLFSKLGLKDEGDICGTPGETFRDTTTRGRASGVALGLPLDRVEEAVTIARDVVRAADAPVLLALRLVKATRATLGFTRYPPATCVLDLDSPQSQRSTAAVRTVWQRLRDAGIPFSFHWGKLNDLDATRVRDIYGAGVDAWIAARRRLLPTPALRRTFANDFTDRLDLSD